ncbi:MAG TPA: thioredoxin domain-containing protein [Candidatus Saccharibacteria bacterium]|nr:thioredoxin domain-containing protein [Candidatus Saccharibacteria bacterium]HMR38499.1 thioredoxin domain-containing protein [Candidatus Saccharibacteria bacterium]
MTKKTWIIFACLVVAFIGGLIFLSKGEKIDVSSIDAATVQGPSEKNGQIGDHVLGKADSKVLLFEYADYQCPGCAQSAPVIKQVAEKYKDKIGFVFRNFPIPSLHPNARAAAAAAEAAGLQNKYWEMHDVLFANQSAWQGLNANERAQTFTEYAVNLGLDKEKFAKDMTSQAVSKKIDFDQAIGKSRGVTGTPSLFINGKKVDQHVKDGKIVPAARDTTPIYASPDDLIKLILMPEFKKAGIEVTEE